MIPKLCFYLKYPLRLSRAMWMTLWWKYIPGVILKVKWPNGDPNDYYREWMEKHVGKQSWDWDWVLYPDDILSNTLTIKLRSGKEIHSTMIGLMWS